jgi:hypothetical protein
VGGQAFENGTDRRNDRLCLDRRDRREGWEGGCSIRYFQVSRVGDGAELLWFDCLRGTSCDERYGQKPDTYESAGF